MGLAKITNVMVTGAAAAYVTSPPWEAITVQSPTVNNVTNISLTVQTPGVVTS